MPASQPAGAPRPAYRPLMGILFMCLAGSFFPVMNGLAKLMSQSYASEQVVWARTLSHLIFVLALFVPRHGWRIVQTRRPGVQFFRSCMLISSTFLFFSAIKVVPIAQAASISFTAPLIVVLLAGPMLGEKVGLMAGDDANPPFPLHLVIARELEIVGSHGMAAHAYPRLLRMVADGRLDPARLVTRRLTLAEAPAALAALAEAPHPGVTVIVP